MLLLGGVLDLTPSTLYVNEVVGEYECVLWLVFCSHWAIRRAYDFARRMFGQPRSLSTMQRSLYGLYTYAIFMWQYVGGLGHCYERGGDGAFKVVLHVFVNLTLYTMGVLWMRFVFTWML